MKRFISRTENGAVIYQTNDDDVITHEVAVSDDPNAPLLEIADDNGWQALKDEPEDGEMIFLEPIPTPVKFVGEVTDDQILDLVRQNGLGNALSVVSTEPDEGGLVAYVMTNEPVGWEWGNPTEFA